MKTQLVRSATGKIIVLGQDVRMYDGNTVTVLDMMPDTGRVLVKYHDQSEPKTVAAFVIGCLFKVFQ